MNRVYATHKSSNTSKNNFKIVCSTVTQEIKLELKKSKYPNELIFWTDELIIIAVLETDLWETDM